MANGFPQAVPPLGTVPLRNYLRGFGVPDSMIQFDPETQSVRVGNQMIHPEANLRGQTFASPDVLQRALKAVNSHLMPAIQPPTQPTQPVFAPSTDPLQGLPSPGTSLMGGMASVGQAMPVLQSLLQGMQDIPLTPGAVDIFGGQTGYLPGGQSTLARSQFEETRRANLAREGLESRRIELAQSAEQRAGMEQLATVQFMNDIRGGAEYGEALVKAVAAGGDARTLATLAGPLIDDPTKDAAIIEGIKERYGTHDADAVYISNFISAPNRAAATNEYLQTRSLIIGNSMPENIPPELFFADRLGVSPEEMTSEQYEQAQDFFLQSLGYDIRRWLMAIDDKFPLEPSEQTLHEDELTHMMPARPGRLTLEQSQRAGEFREAAERLRGIGGLPGM